MIGSQSLFLLDLAMLPTAAQMSTSEIGRRVLSPAMAKGMLALIETIEGESSNPDRVNAVTDSPRGFFQCTRESTPVLVSLVWLS